MQKREVYKESLQETSLSKPTIVANVRGALNRFVGMPINAETKAEVIKAIEHWMPKSPGVAVIVDHPEKEEQILSWSIDFTNDSIFEARVICRECFRRECYCVR